MKTFITTLHTLLVAALMLLPLAGQAQEISESALTQIEALIDEKDSRTPAEQKMDSQLVYLSAQQQGQPVANGVPTQDVSSVELTEGNRVLVDIFGTVTQPLLDAVTQAGGEIVNQFPPFGTIRARVPVSAIEPLAARADVRSIGPAAQAITNMGAVVSEADRTHRARTARLNLGVNGSGVKIGVLSDGVSSLTASISNGNINGDAVVLPGQAGTGDEGTAMMELIQDLAPGAQLYFATAFNGNASFANNILALQAAGCTIIVDDITYFNESPFQDQIISQAVETVSAAGVLYFSSAGNSGNKNDGTSGTWEGDFVSGGAVAAPVTGTGTLLDFGGGTTFNTVAAGGSSRRVDMFWADPDLASTNDYDLFVLDSTGTSVLRSSTNVQNGTQSPYEAVGTLNVGERIVVVKRTGAADRFINLTTGRARLTISTSGVVRGHNASGAANAFCVAATNVANSPDPNVFVGGATNPVETFSSDGPRRIFFQPNGTAITPGNFSSTGGSVLNKPDITAADGTATTVPGFTTFFGTSAAAPHAAAIAALLKSYRPSLTAAQIRTAMTSTALDIEAVGPDRDSGAGIVMAEPALLSVATPDVLTVTTSGDLNATGNVGGPFTPNSTTYTLTNTSGASLNWTAAKTEAWVDLSPTSGTLGAGASVVVTCSINAAAAAALSGGGHTDTVTITNTTSGFARTLAVNLNAVLNLPKLVFDSFSGASLTTTGTTPRSFMGHAITLSNAAGTSNIALSGGTAYLASVAAVSYSNVRLNITFWGAASGATTGTTQAFSNPLGTFSYDLGALTTQANTFYSVDFTLPSAVVFPTQTGGVTYNWQGDTGGGLASTDNLTALIRHTAAFAVGLPAAGTSPTFGYYRNVAGETNGNFNGSSFRTIGASQISLAVQLMAAAVPTVSTPTSTAITINSATLGGDVNHDGGGAITARGVVLSPTALNADPLLAGANVTNLTTPGTTGVFTLPATGLTPATNYTFKAYATNAAGTTYSIIGTFTTLAAAPEIAVFDGSGTGGAQRTDNVGTHGFGSVNTGSSSAAQTFTIQNTGTVDLTGIAVTKAVTGNPGDFTVNTTGMLTTLAPSATTTFTVTFSPTTAGAKGAVVNIASNDGDENPFEINVSGTAQLVTSVYSNHGIAQAGLAMDKTSRTLYFAEHNNTNSPLYRVASSGVVSVVKPAVFCPNFWPYIATEIEFYNNEIWVNVSSAIRRINVTNGNHIDYAGGNPVYEAGVFERNGLLYFSGGSSGTNLIWSFNPSTGAVAPFSNPGFPIYAMEYDSTTDAIWVRDGSLNLRRINPATGAVMSTLTFSSGMYQFAIEPGGAYAYQISGNGIERINLITGVRSVVVTGLISNYGSNDLIFGPSSSGSTWSLYCQSGTQILEIRGFESTSTPEIAVLNSLSTNIPDGGSQAFGTTDVAETLTQTFTVNNTGSGALNLTGITFDGANPGDFTVTTAPGLSTLPATTGTTTFVVTFKPLQSGPRSAVMHIASNDADENPFDITLTGTGTRFIGSNWTGSPIVTIPPSGSFIATGLNFDTDLGFVPTPGVPLTFINIQGLPPAGIIGTFNDLPDGGVVAMSFNGVIYYFQVDYTAGTDGNDMVLTNFTPSGPPAWKHQAGPVARNAVAIFGVKGTGADANNPGARQGAMNWLDDDGDLWMFGGYGYAQSVTNPPRYLNDLWRYDRSAGQWIWVSGANVHNQFGNYTDPILANRTPGSRHTGTTWKDSDGDLWLFGGFGIGTTPGVGRLNDLWRFDTGTLLWTHMKGSNVTGAAGVYGAADAPGNTPGARQGATGWATDGFLWLFGGTTDGGTTHHNDLWRYSIASGNWTVIKGSAATNLNGTYAGAPAANTPGARRDATGWVAQNGTLWLFGGSGLAATGTTLGDMSDLWSFDPVTGNWTHISGPTTQGSTGTYTALNAAGTPAARSAGSGWVTVDGDLWLVGGFKNGKDCYNDVWIYDIGTGVWTWKLGSSSTNVGGSYGGGNDAPGARFTPSTWVTLNGTLWLFGGGGYDVFGNGGRMSDLWSYGIPNPVGAPWDEAQPEPFPAELIVNADPNTSDASADTMAYVPVSGQLTGSDADGDKLLFSAAGSTLSQGTLTLNPDGTWTYVPAAGFTGSTAFQFKASDNYGGESAVRTLVITVSTNLADSDGDGIADGYEYEQWGSLASADGEGDADLDGQSNYFEFLAGTDPQDAGERLATAPSVAGAGTANGTIKLQLNHVRPGVNYHLETSSDLDEWTRLGTFTFSVAGSAEIEDPTPATGAPKFYRMNLEATPAVVLP